MQLFESHIACSSITALRTEGEKHQRIYMGKNICENNLIIDFIGLAEVMAPFLTVTQLFCTQRHFVSNDSLVQPLDHYTRMTTTFRFI